MSLKAEIVKVDTSGTQTNLLVEIKDSFTDQVICGDWNIPISFDTGVSKIQQIREAVNITLNALDKQQKAKDECSLSKEEIVGLMGLEVECTPIITPQEDLVMQESVRQALIRLNMLDFSNIDLNDKQSLGTILKDVLTILWIKFKD